MELAMHRAERILIKPSDTNYRAVARLCRTAKTVYNCASYLMRQSFFDGALMHCMTADKLLKAGFHEHPSYSTNPNAMSQAIIKKLGDDWKSYFAALAEWKKTPAKFKGKPKMPGYARHSKTASMPFQHLSCVDNHIQFPKKTGIEPIRINCCEKQELKAKGEDKIILEIRFVPHGSCYWLEVVYEKRSAEADRSKAVLLDKSKHLSIDLGINNLATLVSDQPGFRPVLINGRVVKSVNHLFNKDVAKLRSKGHKKLIEAKSVKRFCWINDHFHKASRLVIQTCLEHDIGTLVIGHNPGWKQGVNIGKVNNQKFVSIPHAKLIEQIRYKAEEYGIQVIVREESYTSKASALDLDPVPNYEAKSDAKSDAKHRFSGRRAKRGLYQAACGLQLNADVNGALNILRKEIGDSFLKAVADEGNVLRPKRVTIR
jgi:putative transposase